MFATLAGLACFVWAFIAWLTVIPNQDMLADAVQVQSLFTDPRVVLSFPGQKHAGPVEYPFQILAEMIAPANFYVHTFPRVLFAFLTGFFTAKLFLSLFPQGKHWAFLTSIAIGPAIIHGLSGPEGNTVGVWWLVGNYDTSWLLVVIGALLFSKGVRNESRVLFPVAGVTIGLGFFAHPNVIILIIPLGTLTFLILRPRIHSIALMFFGFAIGIAPALFSYIFFTGNNTWDPSRVPFFIRDMYLNSLGLNGIPDYISAVLPYAFGLPTSQFLISGILQSTITWVILIALTVTAIIGWFQAFVRKSWPATLVLVATAWCAAALGIMLFVTFVDTVWFYATSLSILFWITVGALPSLIRPRVFANTLTSAILILELTSMFSHNWSYLLGIPGNIAKKADYQNDIRETAYQLENSGVDIVYGSYLDVIPISYGSSFNIQPISTRYNRFPLMPTDLNRNFHVAVNSDPTDTWGEEGLHVVRENCLFIEQILSRMFAYEKYLCSGRSISPMVLK